MAKKIDKGVEPIFKYTLEPVNVKFYACPNCTKHITHCGEQRTVNFCWNCGTKIDWSKVELRNGYVS